MEMKTPSEVRKALSAHVGADPRRKFWKSYQNPGEGEISSLWSASDVVLINNRVLGSAAEPFETQPANSAPTARSPLLDIGKFILFLRFKMLIFPHTCPAEVRHTSHTNQQAARYSPASAKAVRPRRDAELSQQSGRFTLPIPRVPRDSPCRYALAALDQLFGGRSSQ